MKLILVVALLMGFAMMAPALAGTTGGISGVVTEVGTTTPIAGVTITVTSPSQSASTTTDARGHFAFVSLAPDEYTISLEKSGYAPLSYAGVAVLADAQQTLSLSMRIALKTIANVTSRSASSLVRPGTTADIYSINAAQQARTAVLGGGGALNSAYSAIASVPGAYVPANQNGYLQAVHIRGGDASEVGYEFDGIPVNRAFDNYPSGSLSSLGQLELQVYTGATPANAEAQGLAGFVNQVIKTGTFPGYATANLSAGYDRSSITALTSKPAARRPTATSRITLESAATIRITATSISSAARLTRTSLASSSPNALRQAWPSCPRALRTASRTSDRTVNLDGS